MSVFEPTAEQIFALEENQRLQSESRQIEYVIEHSRGNVSELLARLRENLEKIKALNTRELCKNLVPRR